MATTDLRVGRRVMLAFRADVDRRFHGLHGQVVRVDEDEVYGYIVEFDEPYITPAGNEMRKIRFKAEHLVPLVSLPAARTEPAIEHWLSEED